MHRRKNEKGANGCLFARFDVSSYMLNFTSILTPHFLLNYAVAQAELVGASGSITVYTNYFCTTPAPYPFPGFNFGDYQDSDSDNFAVVDYEYSGPRLWSC